MVTERDIEVGISVLRANGATRIILFGSAVDAPGTARDLDLACEGVPPGRFYRVVAELADRVGKPVDLVDLDEDTPMTRLILAKGHLLYDARRAPTTR